MGRSYRSLEAWPLAVASLMVLTACGGGGGAGSSPPVAVIDTTLPVLSFNPASLVVEAGQTGTATLSVSDNVGIVSGPTIRCTNGGAFANGVFSAPQSAEDLISVCAATARDAAGNEGSAELTVTVTGSSSTKGLIGAANEELCEQAARAFASDCYIIDGTEARMYGVIGLEEDSLDDFEELRRRFPQVSEIILIEVPGSVDDELNVVLGRAVHNAQFNTRMLASSRVASGGVDFFLAGVERSIAKGAEVGVHSWGSADGISGADLPRNDPLHRLYLDYYEAINYADGEDFYFFTLQAAGPDDIHIMSESEIERFNLVTRASVEKVTMADGALAFPKSDPQWIGRHQVIVEDGSRASITGDAFDTDFIIPSAGTHFIDGGAGSDRLKLPGSNLDYRILNNDGYTAIDNVHPGRDLLIYSKNIEALTFAKQ